MSKTENGFGFRFRLDKVTFGGVLKLKSWFSFSVFRWIRVGLRGLVEVHTKRRVTPRIVAFAVRKSDRIRCALSHHRPFISGRVKPAERELKAQNQECCTSRNYDCGVQMLCSSSPIRFLSQDNDCPVLVDGMSPKDACILSVEGPLSNRWFIGYVEQLG